MNPTNHKALPASLIAEFLELNPLSKSGLRWRRRDRRHFKTENAFSSWNSKFSGKDAGTASLISHRKRVYYIVSINNNKFLAHRIVWMLSNQQDPGTLQIDHIDGDSTNNAPANLRIATNAQNSRNRSKQRNNSSGYKGVSWNSQARKWVAFICRDGIRKNLGLFEDRDLAAQAYQSASAALFGEFHCPTP